MPRRLGRVSSGLSFTQPSFALAPPPAPPSRRRSSRKPTPARHRAPPAPTPMNENAIVSTRFAAPAETASVAAGGPLAPALRGEGGAPCVRVAVGVTVPEGDALPVGVPEGVAVPVAEGVGGGVTLPERDVVLVVEGDAPWDRVAVGDAVMVALAVVVEEGVGPGEGVAVPVSVPVALPVGVCVPEGVALFDTEPVAEGGAPAGSDGAGVALVVPRPLSVAEGVGCGVPVGVGVALPVLEPVGVGVGVAGALPLTLPVTEGDASRDSVAVGVALFVALPLTVELPVAGGVGVPVAEGVGVGGAVPVGVAVPLPLAGKDPEVEGGAPGASVAVGVGGRAEGDAPGASVAVGVALAVLVPLLLTVVAVVMLVPKSPLICRPAAVWSKFASAFGASAPLPSMKADTVAAPTELRRRAASYKRVPPLSTIRATRTMQAGQAAATPAASPVVMMLTAAAVSAPVRVLNADAGRPLRRSDMATLAGSFTHGAP